MTRKTARPVYIMMVKKTWNCFIASLPAGQLSFIPKVGVDYQGISNGRGGIVC